MILEKVKGLIEEYNLFEKGERVLVAVSGGVDSVTLLHVLVELSPLYKLNLHVIHLDHKIRGIDSYEDSLFVQDLALKYGLNFTIGRKDAKAERKGESPEESARRVRYDFFRRCLESLKADKIALAHNADDQVETILMRLLRGTGPAGLCGMRPKSPPYVRPLLKVWRSEIEKYASEKGLSYRTDLTNYDLRYFRNRIRHLLIPTLREYNPHFKEALLRLSELMWLEREFIDALIEESFEKEAVIERKGYCFKSSTLRKNRFLFLETIRKAIEKLRGNLFGFSKEDLEKIWKNGIGVYILPKEIEIRDDGNKICIKLKEQKKSFKNMWLFELQVPGDTEIPSGIIKANYVSQFKKPTSENEAFIDADKVKFPLFVRNRREGDRIQPIGMKGMKKLKKLLAEAHIPQEEKDNIPIVVDSNGDIIWIAGVKLSEKAKVDQKSERILHLIYVRE